MNRVNYSCFGCLIRAEILILWDGIQRMRIVRFCMKMTSDLEIRHSPGKRAFDTNIIL